MKEYDETNPRSIEIFAQRLIGKSFSQICDEDNSPTSDFVHENFEYRVNHENKKRKGGLGEIIEERFFHYKANNDSRADFDKAGVELKVTPYRVGKKGELLAKERLIITMIDYFNVVNERFEDSHVWKKSRLILLVYYLYQKEIENRLDYKIHYAKLFTPSEQDLMIIRNDYEIIVEKIRNGKAHELSEGDTMYLGAATKASSSKDRRKQPFSEELAKPRAFSFKNSYMTYVLNNYIANKNQKQESIIKENVVDSFQDYVVGCIEKYSGYTVEQLCDDFSIEYQRKPKNLGALLAYRILGVKGNSAEEFEKAGIVVKTIRIGLNDKIKEHMSFPNFKFKELVNEEWENSTFGSYLNNTRFFFVVYKELENHEYILKGCQFWNIPYSDLEYYVRPVWEKTKQVLIDGLQITEKNGKRYNNFPAQRENPVCHVRPHARNANDVYELPDGRLYTKQCFWLNNSYIYSQLNEKLKSGA